MPAARAALPTPPFWIRRAMLDRLYEGIQRNRAGAPVALVSVCSAHPDVLRAALNWAERGDRALIVEATSNQVNQDGGYTGLRPRDFAHQVRAQATAQGVAWERLILGGDHLGPQAWKTLSADAAMAKSVTLVDAYVAAGFQKIHLDCSHACADDPEPLDDTQIAQRSAQLAQACERACERTRQGDPPAYVIGTEVPTPGGGTRPDHRPQITSPQAARRTLDAHAQAGLGGLKDRIVGLVVQPGVEFLPLGVHALPEDDDPQLRDVMLAWPRLVLEAHSTDYQRPRALRRLAEWGFGFLKVGPALTFAVRQALYSLDQALTYGGQGVGLFDRMERVMLDDDQHWRQHYDPHDKLARHFGLSDRIRYYWTAPRAQRAVAALRVQVQTARLPDPVLRQVFAPHVLDRADQLAGPLDQRLIDASVEQVLDAYTNGEKS